MMMSMFTGSTTPIWLATSLIETPLVCRSFWLMPHSGRCHHHTERTSSSVYDLAVRNTTELRGEILAAARTEFAQYGLAGARIDRIAGSAHASKERLYAHFADKEALFRDAVAARD